MKCNDEITRIKEISSLMDAFNGGYYKYEKDGNVIEVDDIHRELCLYAVINGCAGTIGYDDKGGVNYHYSGGEDGSGGIEGSKAFINPKTI